MEHFNITRSMNVKTSHMIVFLLFVAMVSSSAVPCTQERITACLLEYMDTDKDNKISEYEFNTFVLKEPCGSDSFNSRAVDIFPFCDINKDGYLDAADYDETVGCVRVASVRTQICKRCDKCDLITAK